MSTESTESTPSDPTKRKQGRPLKPVMTDALISEAFSEYSSGSTLGQIALMFNVSPNALSLAFRQYAPEEYRELVSQHRRDNCFRINEAIAAMAATVAKEAAKPAKSLKWEKRSMTVKPFSVLSRRANKETGELSYIYITNEMLASLTEAQRERLFANNLVQIESDNPNEPFTELFYHGKVVVVLDEVNDDAFEGAADDDEDDDILYYENYRNYYAVATEEI